MSYFFGGGFTAPPSSTCKLVPSTNPLAQHYAGPVPLGPIRPAAPPPPMQTAPPPQQYTQQIHQLGIQGRVLGVVPAPAPVEPQQAPPPPHQVVQAPGPFGPVSYPVMKKGEAPCPVCRG
jgi:hypothetical protein